MKKIITFIVAATAIFLVSCGESPKSAALKFSESIAGGKISEAKKYTTEQTGRTLDDFADIIALQEDKGAEFVFVEEEITGDKAIVKVKETQSGRIDTVDLTKVDGEWKVQIILRITN